MARDETSSSSDDDDNNDYHANDNSHDDVDCDPKIKKAWKKLLEKLDEYFDDEKSSTSCGKFFKRGRRKEFFEEPDTNLFCAIHHAVLHNNLYVLKQLVDKYGCGKNTDPVCCRNLSQSHYGRQISREESAE